MLDPDRLSKDVSILAHWQATRLPEPQFPLLENGSSSELNTSCPSGVWHTAQDAPTFLPPPPPNVLLLLLEELPSILWEEALRSREADFQVISPPVSGCRMDFDQEQGDIWQKLLMRD